MKSLFLAISVLFCGLLSANETQGGQFKDLGPWEVHYIAFPSTFVQPSIAKAYGLKRGDNLALINISVLADKPGKPALSAKLSGVAKDLLGKTQPLDFKEVKDGEAIYYLAQIKFDDEEVYRFDIEVSQGTQRRKLQFQQKLYVD